MARMMATMESQPCRVAAEIAGEPSGSMARNAAVRLLGWPLPQWTRCKCAVHPSRRGKRRRDQGRPQAPVARPTPTHARTLEPTPRRNVPRAYMAKYLPWQTCGDRVPVGGRVDCVWHLKQRASAHCFMASQGLAPRPGGEEGNPCMTTYTGFSPPSPRRVFCTKGLPSCICLLVRAFHISGCGQHPGSHIPPLPG